MIRCIQVVKFLVFDALALSRSCPLPTAYAKPLRRITETTDAQLHRRQQFKIISRSTRSARYWASELSSLIAARNALACRSTQIVIQIFRARKRRDNSMPYSQKAKASARILFMDLDVVCVAGSKGRARRRFIAKQETTCVERNIQPLVRIERNRICPLESR